MTTVSRLSCVLAFGGTALVACGSRSELFALGVPVDAGADASEDAAPDVVVGDEPGACVGEPIAVTLNAPNLYFVLDHSTSMNEENKWANIRTTVANLITQIGAGARFGAAMFPGVSAASACNVGVQVMSLRQGDAQGVVAQTFLNATAAAPQGGTPTAATLQSLIPTLSNLPGATFAILATDGGPNCNAQNGGCSIDQCTSNIDSVGPCLPGTGTNCCTNTPESCLDEVGTVNAAGNLKTAGVKTFVLGIPGSAAYGTVLDQVAIAGGSARATEPFYYQVTTSDDAALQAAFESVVQQTGAGCTFTLATLPTILPGVHATLDGVTLPTSGPNRWTLTGTTLTLLGTSCATVRNAGAPSLLFFNGCSG